MTDSKASEQVFYHEKHVEYIKKVANDTESFEFLVSQYLRMSGVYWGMAAIGVLGEPFERALDPNSIVQWLLTCQDKSTGGFGGNTNHDSHLLYTLSALQILAMTNNLDLIDKFVVAKYISSLQQEDGSFIGDIWGEVDTRFALILLYVDMTT